MVERSGCNVEESGNGASLHNDGSTSTNSIVKNSFQSVETNNRFSIFKWFKRNASALEYPSTNRQIINDDHSISEVSSSESVDTYYSTATVKSFAFHSGTLESSAVTPINLNVLQENQRGVGPFASGASKVTGNIGNESTNVTQTLPVNVLLRSRDITARYSLQSCTTGIGSCNNINNTHQLGLASSLRRLDNRPGQRRFHVRGKRRAPNPPGLNPKPRSACVTNVISSSQKRKRRPAPKPPDVAINTQKSETNGMNIGGEVNNENYVKTKNVKSNIENLEKLEKAEPPMEVNKNQKSISNDTLVLRGGILLPKREITIPNYSPIKCSNSITSFSAGHPGVGVITSSPNFSVMPRPWYKRSVFENSSKKIEPTRVPVSIEIRNDPECTFNSSAITKNNINHSQSEKSPNEGSLSRLRFFNRDKSVDDKRKEIQRRSGLSILTNISELDKEAAAIVQKEQARSRALFLKQSSLSNDTKETKTNNNQHEVIQDIVTSAMESSPRRGTRALISKFNAIGNITKITVNSNFFNTNICTKEQTNVKTTNDNWRNKMTCNNNSKVHPDLSRYFPQSKSPKIRRDVQNSKSAMNATRYSVLRGTTDNVAVSNSEIIVKSEATKKEHPNLISDVTNRLSALQTVVAKNSFDNFKRSSPIVTTCVVKSRKESIIDGDNNDVDDVTLSINKASGSHDNSPNIYQTKVFKTDGEKKNLREIEIIEPEFTNIFEAMDKQQLSSSNLKPSNQYSNKKKNHLQVGTPKQVSKVLDILVETQKIGRNCGLEINRKFETKSKTSLLLNTIDDPTTVGLKEMLKEMKHSLPKRSKPKRINERILPTTIDPMNESNALDSYLLNQVKVIHPPVVHVTASKMTKHLIKEDNRDPVKQHIKVSSAVQTSGNVRKVITISALPSSSSTTSTSTTIAASTPSTSQENYNDIICKTIQNKFQLMRPREFAAIGAIKTIKRSKDNDNTYANVIEQSVYANAMVFPSQKHQIIPNNVPWNSCKIKLRLPELDNDHESHINLHNDDDDEVNSGETVVALSAPQEHLQAAGYRGNKIRTMNITEKNMDTMAVNRMIKKLEGAIASGNHQQAAGFAKDLARLKIQCSVIRRKPKDNDVLNVDMYIEDRLTHNGPIPLQVPLLMTVTQLKEKIFNDFNIPTNVQRWIINNILAENDNATLKELHAVDGSPVFLYLVIPDLQINDPVKVTTIELHQNNIVKCIKDTDDDNEIIVDNRKNLADEDDTIQMTDNKQELPETLRVNKPVQLVIKLNQQKIEEKIIQNTNIEVFDAREEEGAVALIKKTEPEEYKELMMLESCDIVPNTDSIECPICFLKYDPLEGVLLRGCLHAFCRTCLVNTIKHCDDAEVKCPYGDPVYSCESSIQEREIKALVEPDVYELHLAKSISQAESSAGENAFHCKTPDCSGWCLYDYKPNHFLCPVCKKTNCLTCRVIHEGQNCLEYQENIRLSKETDHESKRTAAMLANMLDRGEAMNCPTCNVLLMKKMGCDWLKCSMCKTEICWVTKGPRWGPGGPGDTSGGCRCNVNGTKCHANCNYCH